MASASSLVRITAPRGPRRVLCVVVVTTCACGKGEGCAPPATSPAKCAMSTIRKAPTSSAICAEGGKVDGARIGAAAGDDHLGLVLARERRHLVHVDAMVLPAHRVGHHLEPLARHVHRRAVRQMSAGRQAQPHEGVAGLHQRHERGLVGGAARVRLHVGEVALEQLLGALDRQRLRLVDVLAAAVVAVAGIAFGVLVGENRADRLQHGARDDVLRRDQLDLVLLAFELPTDHAGELRIALVERGGEEARLRRLAAPGGCGGHGMLSA